MKKETEIKIRCSNRFKEAIKKSSGLQEMDMTEYMIAAGVEKLKRDGEKIEMEKVEAGGQYKKNSKRRSTKLLSETESWFRRQVKLGQQRLDFEEKEGD